MSESFLPEDEPRSYPVATRDTVYAGAVWDVVRETFDFDGHPLTRDFVDHTGAVAVVAINEHDEVMLIRQYRHAIRSLNWEIPAGLLDVSGEDPLVCGQRELAEEADLHATDWTFLTTLNTTPGGSNEFITIYRAEGLSSLEHDYVREGEEAQLEKRFVPFKDALFAATTGLIRNQIAVTALLVAHAHRS